MVSRFFDSLLFVENPGKGDRLYEKLVNKTEELKFEMETNFSQVSFFVFFS
jgi:hypothetical protein